MKVTYSEDHETVADEDHDGHRVGRETEEDDREDELENTQDDEALGISREVLPPGNTLGRTHCL